MKFSKVDKSCFFDGQNNILKADLQMEYTEHMLREIERCRDDIGYFCRKYVMVINPDKGLIQFDLYDYEAKMLDIMSNNRFSIFLLARQMGKTSTVAAFLLHEAIFNDDFEIAILANKEVQAREILSRLQLMYAALPLWLQPGVRGWNKGDIQLGNGKRGTRVFCAATGGTSIRGRTVNILYLDEFAFVQNDSEFYTSTYPTITAGTTTRVVITSTPKGMNQFYKIYHDAEQGLNEYAYLKVDWTHHPKRTEAWKRTQLKNMTQRQFDQEFNVKFLGSAGTLISGEKLQSLVYSTPTYIDETERLRLYRKPEPGHQYVACVDVAEGVGGDYSIVDVIDVTSKPFRQVAVYRCNTIIPVLFADVVYRVASAYNKALTLVECNSIGYQVVHSLWDDYEYDNLMQTEVKNSIVKEGSGSSRTELGVRTTAKTRQIGVSTLKGLIETDTLVVDDFETVSELCSFVKKTNKYEAESGKHDDLVMTLVLFAWLTTQESFGSQADVNMNNYVRSGALQSDDFVVGYFQNGIDYDDDEVDTNFFKV